MCTGSWAAHEKPARNHGISNFQGHFSLCSLLGLQPGHDHAQRRAFADKDEGKAMLWRRLILHAWLWPGVAYSPLPLPHISSPEALHNAVYCAQKHTPLPIDVTLVLALQSCSCRFACLVKQLSQSRPFTAACISTHRTPHDVHKAVRTGLPWTCDTEHLCRCGLPKAKGAPQPMAHPTAMSAAFPVASCAKLELLR